MDFVGHYSSFLCAYVRSRTFPGVPVSSHAFSMHPNRPLSEIIRQSRVILCVFYGLESAFVVYSPIPCVPNGPNRPL